MKARKSGGGRRVSGTDLEHAALGIIWLEEPVSPYRIRREFARSPSGHWKASAGTIYPLIERLRERGLIVLAAKRGDGRATQLCSLTEAGRAAVRAWLGPPLPDGADLMPVDPLRVRVRFLALLPPAQRGKMVASARARLAAQLERLEALAREQAGAAAPWPYYVTRGAALSVAAQLAWLDEVAQELDA